MGKQAVGRSRLAPRVRRASLVALAAVAGGLGTTAAAQAAAPSGLPSQARAAGAGVWTLSGPVADKRAAIAQLETALGEASPGAIAARAKPRVKARASVTQSLSGSHSRAILCSSAYARFSDTITHPLLETSATVDGSSRTAWLGSCPFNAASVHLQDTVCFDSVGFSVSVGGAGFSAAGGGCGEWNGSVGNTWYINHSYSGLKGSGSLVAPIWRVRQSSSGTYKFGSSFYTVVANGSTII